MRKLLKAVTIVVIGVVVLALGAYGWAYHRAMARYETKWSAHDASFPIPFPLDSAEAASLAKGGPSADPSAEMAASARAVHRGEHLVTSRLGCNGCHGDDFGGKVLVDVPIVGTWAAPNLTLGNGGVTAGFSANDWDLAVRHGIKHTGTSSSMPCADFTTVADHELSDVVAYIRSRPPVDRSVPSLRLGPVFALVLANDPKALAAFVIDHARPHAVEPPEEAVTLGFGEHLVQGCRGCHRANLSGGKVTGDPNMPFVRNITPDTSGIGRWTQADFVRAMREGRRPDGGAIDPAMPWKTFRNMDDTELAALWGYLRATPPLPTDTR